MLDEARARAALSIRPERTVFVLARSHERFYRPLLADVSADNLVVQHANRGTAPAILYALLRIAVKIPTLASWCSHQITTCPTMSRS